MEKTKEYKRVKFTSQKLKEAIAVWESKLPEKGRRDNQIRRIVFSDETWGYDNNEEFFADFQKEYETAYFGERCFGKNDTYSLSVESRTWQNTSIEVQAPTRAEIEDVFHVFEKDWENFKLPEDENKKEESSPTIFIGHGRSPQWRDLKDHLTDKHGYRVDAYETGARAGHTIRDILEDMLTRSSIALLVHTGEDELMDGTISARPNVVHETGLFQGKLGFSKAIVLLENGTSEFSNLYGIQQIRFSKDNIK